MPVIVTVVPWWVQVGVEVVEVRDKTLVLSDGSSIADVDVLLLGTGYLPPQHDPKLELDNARFYIKASINHPQAFPSIPPCRGCDGGAVALTVLVYRPCMRVCVWPRRRPRHGDAGDPSGAAPGPPVPVRRDAARHHRRHAHLRAHHGQEVLEPHQG